MLPDARRRLPLLLALGLIAAGCGRAIPEPSDRIATRAAPAVAHAPERSSPAVTVSAFRFSERMQTPDPAWLAAAREDPDPNVRLHALETWAQHPGESLDPVTYALVDADESVRTRAQELVEQVWAAKAEGGRGNGGRRRRRQSSSPVVLPHQQRHRWNDTHDGPPM